MRALPTDQDVESQIDLPNHVEFFHGHGFYSGELYGRIMSVCDDLAHPNVACQALLNEMSDQIGAQG